MTARDKITRAEWRVTERWRRAFLAAGGTEAEYLSAVQRFRRANRVLQLRRNQAGVTS